ncbi:Rz-like lysis system protein LysB [Collimonas sp. OK412]|jgi:LysB family phage lysis regulatory protein|uniref:Rz-like lysis system protein LysB n=1 Tax=Collimonas sp. (strain OK412) TaxID=1801619 RepID=UPI0008E7A5BF|nr:Rz-like lysis system protein LysB [Collimonas sp. OK412]SFD28659.1 phage lysis regulatory protein, LysB family [Collimonas sp. OK412]
MEMIVKSLISALFVGALGLVIYVQYNGLKEAQSRIKDAEQATRDRDGTIKTLKAAADRDKRAAAKLQGERNSIAATLTERENLIENLQHENATIRSWADAPLPDAIARLRERAAVTGAAAYAERLPSGDALSAAGGSAQD